jgi:hypothetical protein
MKRVAFPAFQVDFDLEGNESATSVARQVREGGGAQASVSTRYFLKGVHDALCQKVTDQLYASVTAQFQAAGFEVVGLDAVKAAASFAKLPLKPTPFHIDKSKHDSVVDYSRGPPALRGLSRCRATHRRRTAGPQKRP